MSESIPFIDDLVEDYKKTQELLLITEPSAAQDISAHLTKVLILTCASHYEQRLQNAFISYAKQESDKYGDKPHRFDIDKNEKSVYQKFAFGRVDDSDDLRTLPDTKKILEPLTFFGVQFRDKIFDEISGDEEKEGQLKAFQEIFAMRNLIAHQTYIQLTNNAIRGKSFSDIKQLHDKAIRFVDYLCQQFT